jgi:hypothetical protein
LRNGASTKEGKTGNNELFVCVVRLVGQKYWRQDKRFKKDKEFPKGKRRYKVNRWWERRIRRKEGRRGGKRPLNEMMGGLVEESRECQRDQRENCSAMVEGLIYPES